MQTDSFQLCMDGWWIHFIWSWLSIWRWHQSWNSCSDREENAFICLQWDITRWHYWSWYTWVWESYLIKYPLRETSFSAIFDRVFRNFLHPFFSLSLSPSGDGVRVSKKIRKKCLWDWHALKIFPESITWSDSPEASWSTHAPLGEIGRSIYH